MTDCEIKTDKKSTKPIQHACSSTCFDSAAYLRIAACSHKTLLSSSVLKPNTTHECFQYSAVVPTNTRHCQNMPKMYIVRGWPVF